MARRPPVLGIGHVGHRDEYAPRLVAAHRARQDRDRLAGLRLVDPLTDEIAWQYGWGEGDEVFYTERRGASQRLPWSTLR